jgi:hypothetical protein
MTLNTFESIAVSLIGLGIIAGARRLALLPRRWQGFYARHPQLKPPTGLYCDSGIRVLTLFWQFCGALWLAGGVALFCNPRWTILLPWPR